MIVSTDTSNYSNKASGETLMKNMDNSTISCVYCYRAATCNMDLMDLCDVCSDRICDYESQIVLEKFRGKLQ